MSIKVEFVTRIRIVILGMLLFCCVILFKLMFVQFVERDHWISKAERAHVRVRPIKATRGNIYSDDGSLLATSLPRYTVSFDPSISKMNKKRADIFKQGLNELSKKLASYFKDKPAQVYKSRILDAKSTGKRYLPINRRKINYSDKKMMESWPIFKHGQMNGGVIFEKVETRFDPFGSLARRTVGYTRKDSLGTVKGIVGLEFSFNEELGGVDGQQLFQKIGGGIWKPVSEDYIVTPKQGHDLHTTIDVNIQDFAESALRKSVTDNGANNGCAIVMDVKTGDIKALVNIDKIIKDQDTTYFELYNRAVATRYEPGSTIKLASVMAVLEERKELNLNSKVETGDGKYKFFNVEMRDSKYGGHGTLSFKDVFKKSSNIGVAKLVNETFYHSTQAQQKYIDYLSKFQLTNTMDFQLFGAAKPYVKTPEDQSWSGISLPWMSIGYEVEMSPLQMLAFYNAVANNGFYVTPRLVKSVSEGGKVLREFKVNAQNRKICSDETLAEVHEMLFSVVNEEGGTASNIKSSEYSISGKTGTKQNQKNGRYVKEYYATFAGFFPSQNPKYSIIVAIDHPQNGSYYGNDVAAPVFKEIADKIYTNDMSLHRHLSKEFAVEKGVFPTIQSGYSEDLQHLCEELNIEYWGNAGDLYSRAVRDQELQKVKWLDIPLRQEIVPDVVGMTLRDALSLLENQGLKVAFTGRGRVKSQSMNAGSTLVVGSKIRLELE